MTNAKPTDIVVSHPAELFRLLGAAHDVRLRKVELDMLEHVLKLRTDNLLANYDDLPEDRGPCSCTLVFHQLQEISMDLELSEGIRVGGATIAFDSGYYRLEVTLNLGGKEAVIEGKSIVAVFASLSIRDADPNHELLVKLVNLSNQPS
jgi:hypothetical protein